MVLPGLERNRMKILAVGAHPDDVEIGCGGLLAMEGISKHILHLSNGETSKYADGETRRREAEAAASVLAAHVHFFDMPGRGVAADEEASLRLVGLIRQIKPDFLITHWADDAHPDHRGAHELVRRAFFLSGARMDIELPPWKCRNILYFHPFSSAYGFVPEFVLDITGVYHRRLQALRCHGSQQGFILPQVEAVSRYFGRNSGVERAEPFRAEIPVVLNPAGLTGGGGE